MSLNSMNIKVYDKQDRDCPNQNLRFVYITTKTQHFRISIGHLSS